MRSKNYQERIKLFHFVQSYFSAFLLEFWVRGDKKVKKIKVSVENTCLNIENGHKVTPIIQLSRNVFCHKLERKGCFPTS
jgi:hypothetical protein